MPRWRYRNGGLLKRQHKRVARTNSITSALVGADGILDAYYCGAGNSSCAASSKRQPRPRKPVTARAVSELLLAAGDSFAGRPRNIARHPIMALA